ncbi:BRO1 domain-containing BROX [Chlorella sorokiniana]|uniref:BRO1 domain-containing BROX n=1 Tax=Chlorella sorokiniana TaxID=3076 RepID=A0A2P6TI42_CHLSO|nr:BRO1 domain-containing BROX [Chlorella sorokiniana]|eukprot:PRW33962.1 BRO1 domain-containing BROX [Chlorella sorokiniana]
MPADAPQPLLPLSSPLAEEVMVLHMYAALCTEHAFGLASDHLAGSPSTAPGSPDSLLSGTATARPATTAPPSGGSSGEKRSKHGLLRRLFNFRRQKAVADSGGAIQGHNSGGSPAAGADSWGSASPRPCSPYLRTLSRCPAKASVFAGGPATAASFSAASPTAWEGSSLTSPRAPSGSDAAGGLAGAAAWLRRAAGVYGHVEAELLPAAQAAGALPAGDACPVELWPGLAAVLEQLCLAQAQGLAARRAEERGAAPALAAALHRGAAELFESAAAKLLAVQPPSPDCNRTLSVRLRRFPTISAVWHTAAAYAQLAQAQQGEEQLGAAVATMVPALSKAREALAQCGSEADWAAALAPELRRLEKLAELLDRERAVVYVQQVAAAGGELPPSKVMVAPIVHRADG